MLWNRICAMAHTCGNRQATTPTTSTTYTHDATGSASAPEVPPGVYPTAASDSHKRELGGLMPEAGAAVMYLKPSKERYLMERL